MTTHAPPPVDDAGMAWSPTYSLGLEEIDAQHRELFDLLQRLSATLHPRADPRGLLEGIEALEHAAVSHFAAEESFMRITQYPQLASHQAAHAAFLELVADAKTQLQAGRLLVHDALREMKDWQVAHILGADKAYTERTQRKAPPPSFWRRFFGRAA